MKKKLLIGAGVLLLLLAVAGVTAWYFMSQPLYQPGMVRAGQNLAASLVPPAQAGAEDFWQVEPGIQLYHFAEGQGRNVLIVHGGPGMPYTTPWPGLAPLTHQYRFHYYDQRGCGRSTRPIDRFDSNDFYANMTRLDRTLGLGAQIADIERIRQLLGEEKLILIGHSFGGFLASLYAAEFPERVEALVLVAPADVLVMPPEHGGLFEAVRERLPEEEKAGYDAFMERYLSFNDIFSRSEADLVALNSEFGRYYLAVIETPLPEQGEPGGWMAHGMYFSMGLRHDYRPALTQVSAPALVIHAAADLQPEAASRAYAEALPHARFTTIAGSGHFPFYEQPDAFAGAVGDFLDTAVTPLP